MPKKYTYEDVKEYIESKGCKLLSNEYINSSKKLEIECICGNVYNRIFGNFKNQKQYHCKECASKVKSEKLSFGFNYVKSYIENNSNCKLLSDTYKNANTKLLLECNCGNTFSVTLHNFKDGQRFCNTCSNNKKNIKYRFSDTK